MALAAHISVGRKRKLHTGTPAAGQAAKQVATVSAGRHFFNQFTQIGGVAVCVHQGGVRLESQPQG